MLVLGWWWFSVLCIICMINFLPGSDCFLDHFLLSFIFFQKYISVTLEIEKTCISLEKVKTYARLIKGCKYITCSVEVYSSNTPAPKCRSVKDRGEIEQEQAHIVQLFSIFQCFNKIWCLHTKKRHRANGLMVRWLIRHSLSYLIQCAKTCWSLPSHFHCHGPLLLNNSYTKMLSFVGLHLFQMHFCLKWISGHHWKCVCSVLTMSQLFLLILAELSILNNLLKATFCTSISVYYYYYY